MMPPRQPARTAPVTVPNTTPDSVFAPGIREELTQILTDWLVARWEACRAELDIWAPRISLDELAAWSPTAGWPQPRADQEVRCRECGRHLTAATSISAGIGPVCQRRTGPS